jgi:hypothetical protein
MSPAEHDSSGHIECDHRVKKSKRAECFLRTEKGEKGMKLQSLEM